ncbi:hypothetical protein ACQPW1_18595 [Nocardia sp. CA-128927]|uniref:hypothetical protein n=1 Tax=Nocardia sp. CA-128927 TaxID=3239975 RepID=UPI003D997F1F
MGIGSASRGKEKAERVEEKADEKVAKAETALKAVISGASPNVLDEAKKKYPEAFE